MILTSNQHFKNVNLLIIIRRPFLPNKGSSSIIKKIIDGRVFIDPSYTMILLQYKLGIIRKTQQIDGTEISNKFFFGFWNFGGIEDVNFSKMTFLQLQHKN